LTCGETTGVGRLRNVSGCKKMHRRSPSGVRVLVWLSRRLRTGEASEKQAKLTHRDVLERTPAGVSNTNVRGLEVQLLDESNRLKPDAANVLLRSWRAAQRNAIFIADASRDGLFSTLRSRCQRCALKASSDPRGGYPAEKPDLSGKKLHPETPYQILVYRHARPPRRIERYNSGV